MKFLFGSLTLLCSLFFTACNPLVTTQVFQKRPIIEVKKEVQVYDLTDSVPLNSSKIGMVRIDDSGLTTNCSFSYVLELAKMEAAKMGGNAVKITWHDKPNLWSSCHRIIADILYLDSTTTAFNTDTLKQVDTILQPAIQQDMLPLSQAVTGNTMNVIQNPTPLVRILPKFRLSFYAGFSQVLGEMPSNMDAELMSYTKELNSAKNFGVDFTYFITPQSGLGIKYNVMKTSNSIDNIYIEDDHGFRTYGIMSDDIRYVYLGPAYTIRSINARNKNTFLCTFSMGFCSYLDNAVIVNPYTLTGQTLGSLLELGYDIPLSSKMALGLQLTLSRGLLKTINVNDGVTVEQVALNSDSYLSMNHIDFTVGLRFLK